MIADVDVHPSRGRDHVDRSRAHVDDADGRDGALAARVPRESLEHRRCLGGARERVAAHRHRCRAGVRGLAPEGHEQVVRRGDVGHDAKRDAGGLEHAALLDVQLDESMHAGRIELDLADAVGIQADVAHGLPRR